LLRTRAQLTPFSAPPESSGLSETTLIAPERSEAIANSFWDTKEDAEAYNRSGYPEVLKTLTSVLDGTPTVKTFELANPTFHKAAAARLA
jgi:hypothetical protein